MKDVKVKACEFLADIVPYMYGELAASETSAFESHLLDCGECTDEFAAVSSARYEVYDWKKLEFDPLPTPPIRIPYGEVEAPVSWVDRLRAAFTQSWTVPGLAVAGLAIVSIFGVTLYLSGDGGTTVATNSTGTPVTPTQVSKPPESVKREDVAVTASEEAQPAPKPVQVKATSGRKAKSVRAVDKTRPTRAIPVGTTAQDMKAPRLNEFNDDEDTSLRLAMLFEDIDTKE